jgi:hypothetical protein
LIVLVVFAAHPPDELELPMPLCEEGVPPVEPDEPPIEAPPPELLLEEIPDEPEPLVPAVVPDFPIVPALAPPVVVAAEPLFVNDPVWVLVEGDVCAGEADFVSVVVPPEVGCVG